MELPDVNRIPKKTVENIPRDEATRKKITDIIDHQFDLEIYLKQREVATIKQEIEKAENVLKDLKLAIENDVNNTGSEGHSYGRRSTVYQNNLSYMTSATRKKTYRTSDKNQLFGRRHDGVYVSLACPKCHRDDFANQQGFLNHCRISHNLEFGPYEQIMIQCGTPVDESVVPLDNPARMRPIMNIIPSAPKAPLKKIKRPSIKVFEEDVDMDLETEKSRPAAMFSMIDKPSTTEATDSPPPPESDVKVETILADERKTDDIISNTPYIEQPSIPSSAVDSPMTVDTPDEQPNRPSGKSIPHTNMSSEDINTKHSEQNADKQAALVINRERAEMNDKEMEMVVDRETQMVNCKEGVNHKEVHMKLQENREDMPGDQSTTVQQQEAEGKVESVAAALSFNKDISDIGSRFYIKKRITVGNVSKFILPERRDPTLKQFTHKWMIYVVEPAGSKDGVSSFITHVRFHLHPSYKPHDVVDVTEAPFRITRLGWGEFPIRIQLFFVDNKRNKSIDIIHHLKLDESHSGKQVLGGERNIDIELDRHTDFKDISPISRAGSSTPSEVTATEVPMVSAQKMSLLNGILREIVPTFPIIRSNLHGTTLPYTCAPNAQVYFQWSIGKRKALEWHRARVLRLEVQQRAYETMDNVLKFAAESLTTKDVLVWCVENNYTPRKTNMEEHKSIPAAEHVFNGYCRFCGNERSSANEQADDQCPKRPKGWNQRKRNGGINSKTSVSNLLDGLEKGWDDPDEMDVDIDVEDHAPSNVTAEDVIKRDVNLNRVKEWNNEDMMDIPNERALDWIWSVVGQLRLKTVTANDMLLGKDGNLQGPTVNFDLISAMNQRLAVGNIMTQATRIFLKRLIRKTLDICYKEEEGSSSASKMMVPYHLYQAIQRSEEFDFLTNQYMGPEKEP
ncbi:hypothetical protein BDB01DRAFT_851750 [Pilobolus umbonatus]|nr:hypothetical protein BDB01DRAFT_851750 [Pilobolus umbonatus]